MVKPVVRIGDITAHGGAVVVGAMTVHAGGKPVARIGDSHICPMPGHGGGPVIGPGAPTVLVEGKPVALLGDQALCPPAPDVLAMGCPTVVVLGTVINVAPSPQARTLRQAAQSGTPFCAKCAAAARS